MRSQFSWVFLVLWRTHTLNRIYTPLVPSNPFFSSLHVWVTTNGTISGAIQTEAGRLHIHFKDKSQGRCTGSAESKKMAESLNNAKVVGIGIWKWSNLCQPWQRDIQAARLLRKGLQKTILESQPGPNAKVTINNTSARMSAQQLSAYL